MGSIIEQMTQLLDVWFIFCAAGARVKAVDPLAIGDHAMGRHDASRYANNYDVSAGGNGHSVDTQVAKARFKPSQRDLFKPSLFGITIAHKRCHGGW
jgi:hypothetical protein